MSYDTAQQALTGRIVAATRPVVFHIHKGTDSPVPTTLIATNW